MDAKTHDVPTLPAPLRKAAFALLAASSPFVLGGWRRDLMGRVYLDIERATGIPVALLECDTVYD